MQGNNATNAKRHGGREVKYECEGGVMTIEGKIQNPRVNLTFGVKFASTTWVGRHLQPPKRGIT